MIWLLRHGTAEDDAENDAARELTEKGRRQARDAGAALAALGVEIAACLTSPKVRARDTAVIACDALGIEPREAESLAGGDFDAAAVAAESGVEGDVLVVGHEPDFSRAVEAATGGRVKLRKGGLAAIDGDLLDSLLRPPQLHLIATGGEAAGA
jgi:phosphohistidine phosphatase